MSDNVVCPGRVIYGLQCVDHAGLNRPPVQTWNMETEERYMEQVRERAQQMAKDILAQALAQAEQIRASAQTEGFAAGQHDAISIAQAENEKVRIFLNTLQTAAQMLTAAPQDVAKDIYAAFCKKKNIVYSKWFWKWIMHIITMIPECMFVRIKL